MRVGIDIGRALRGYDGVASYSLQLAKGLLDADRDTEYRLYDLDARSCGHDSVARILGDLPANARVCATSRSEIVGLDLFHCTAFRLPPPGARRLVFTIHDLTFISHPALHTAANRARSLTSTAQALARDATVIAVSETTRGAAVDLLSLPTGAVRVIPPVLDSVYRPPGDPTQGREVAARLALRSPYLLHVGSLEPRKNLAGVIAAFEVLSADLRRDLKLVVVSSGGWREREVRARLDAMVRAERALVFGGLTAYELAAIYSGAEALVYPSLVEGFGLPVAEAMACGTPVVTSDRSSLKEISGNAAVLVDPDDPSAIAAGVERILRDSSLRNQLVERGLATCERYSRSRVIPSVLGLYRGVSEDSRSTETTHEST